MSETEPIVPFRPREPGARPETAEARSWAAPPLPRVAFDRKELGLILAAYGAKVAQGEWRDYALDFGAATAIFSIFRRSSEVPLYQIVKDPRLARRQGQYAVIAPGGLIMKRGHDLAQVLRVFRGKPHLVTP
ncbi:MAG: DUF2794 domain-containing protein [Rhizobiales bacterium]|nr:DUF2794 domain-containing protein [Hyphomicrobiales bacterium]